MNKESTKKVTEAQVIAGGEIVEINYRGAKTTAFVRQVRPTELTQYLQAEATGEEAVLAMVATGSDGDTIDLNELDLASFEALIEADQRQNFTAARAKEKRETARAGRQLAILREGDPDTYRELQKKQTAVMESLLSSLGPSSPEQGAGSSAST